MSFLTASSTVSAYCFVDGMRSFRNFAYVALNVAEFRYRFAHVNRLAAAGPRADGGSFRNARVPAMAIALRRSDAGDLISSSRKLRAVVSVRPGSTTAV